MRLHENCRMNNFKLGVVALGGVMAGTILARPVLQPEVKEYVSSKGVADYAAAPVVYQDQRQCRIGADEIPSTGEKTAYAGHALPEAGVFIAIADSALGKKLVADFRLDVPAKKQGYAIRVDGKCAVIVGHDAIGALYGAVTFRQMAAKGGRVECAMVRDWPDVLYRGGASLGRGLWPYGKSDGVDGIKAALDVMMRHKLNIISDFFGLDELAPREKLATWRELVRYARDRGIYSYYFISTALFRRTNKPEGMTLEKWPCVKDLRTWNEWYYCWSDDEGTEKAVNHCADILQNIGAEDGIVQIHPVDGGGWKDPEFWSKRCAKCRSLWNDHERWKATVHQLEIWNRVLRRKCPNVIVGSCIYPYTYSALLTPEKDRTDLWRESHTEYWSKVSEGIGNKEFFFSSWMSPPWLAEQIRRYVPSRPIHFAQYPQFSGIFQTTSRKACSVYEENADNTYLPQGTDFDAVQWESLLLGVESTWNRNMPGAEAFDGGTYYDAAVDHTGPRIVMEQVLPRLCAVFWGTELAPYMTRILSSGVLPSYIRDPGKALAYWNSVRKDPLFDPTVEQVSTLERKRIEKIVDTSERMREQVKAAETVIRDLTEARGHLDGLDSVRRRYFMKLAKYAPFWLATARARYALRAANDLIAAGRHEEAKRALPEGLRQLREEWRQAEENLKALSSEVDCSPRRYVWPVKLETLVAEFERAETSAGRP